jgi:hypothetical protein
MIYMYVDAESFGCSRDPSIDVKVKYAKVLLRGRRVRASSGTARSWRLYWFDFFTM